MENLSWRKELREIFQKCISSTNDEPKNKAIDLINILGSMGNFEYRDLLPTE